MTTATTSTGWRRITRVATLATVAALTLTGIARAGVIDDDGIVHGCYSANTGLLRVIDPAGHHVQARRGAHRVGPARTRRTTR